MEIVSIVFKHGEDDYSVWTPEIPMEDELIQALLSKYENSGCSVRGKLSEIKEEIE